MKARARWARHTIGWLLVGAVVCGLGGPLGGAELKERATLKGHLRIVAFVAFSPEGKTLAAVDPEGVRLWNVSTGKVKAFLRGDAGTVAFAPDSKTIAVGGGGILGASFTEEVKLWNVADGKLKA